MLKAFGPQEFVEALRSKALDEEEEPARSFQGYTREEKPFPGTIEFSPDCFTWWHLPLVAIEKIVYLGLRSCPKFTGGHKHHYIEVYPKKPPAEAEQDNAYYAMLQAVLAGRG